jgi:predicted transcriptional regulator YheO
LLLARIFQAAFQVALHSLQHLTILVKQIANGLKRRIQLHALKGQLEVGHIAHVKATKNCQQKR